MRAGIIVTVTPDNRHRLETIIRDRNRGNDIAWRWRRWISLMDQEGIDAERSAFNMRTIVALRNKSVIRSAAESFRERALDSRKG
jgi:hypothetical protein